jgi:pimeloyl-ACP methyl ester carboxylesterase
MSVAAPVARTAAELIALSYPAACAALWALQDRLVFPAPGGPLSPPAPFERKSVTAADGVEVSFLVSPPMHGKPTVVAFHGNGGRADWMAETLAFLARDGYGVVSAEYRGYGGNPGRPTERGLAADADAVADWAQREWECGAPILFGESIGSGVAVALAARRAVLAVVLDCPFTTLADVARSGILRFFPVAPLLRHRFDSLSLAPSITAPTYVIASRRDRVVPYALAERLALAFGGSCVLDANTTPHCVLASERSGAAAARLLDFLGELAHDPVKPARARDIVGSERRTDGAGSHSSATGAPGAQ